MWSDHKLGDVKVRNIVCFSLTVDIYVKSYYRNQLTQNIRHEYYTYWNYNSRIIFVNIYVCKGIMPDHQVLQSNQETQCSCQE